ncbi:hypothetical protein ABT354_22725 [Streptomyces sp. NPDC000594]|uniref:hypothetical protein n=1 Tax=Streptomyces sp. NPDC000594 TaxID=3154261 RepID=UPI00331F555B
MEPIVYRNRERRRALAWSAVFTGWGVISLVRLLGGAVPGFLDALGVAWLVIVPFVLRVGLGRVTVDGEGIHARRPLSLRRTYPWRDISAITVEERSSRSHGAHRIVIARPGRRPRLLPAPYVDIRASHAWYEELLAQAEEIRARHRAALGSGDGPGDGAGDRPGGGPGDRPGGDGSAPAL